MSNKFALSKYELKNAFYLFAIFFICYSYEITNFNLSIDDEILAYSPVSTFAELGRWVHPLVRGLFWPQVVSPLGPCLIFGISIALGYVYVLKAFNILRFEFFHFASFAAFILFPVWAANLEFSANVIPLGIGTLAASAAVLLTSLALNSSGTIDIKKLGAASFFCAISMGAYPNIILIFLVFMISIALSQFVLKDAYQPVAFGKLIGMSILVLLLALLQHLVYSKLAMLYFGVSTSEYAKQFVNPNDFLQQPIIVLVGMMEDIFFVYFKCWEAFGVAGYVFLVALFVAALASLHVVRHSAARILVVVISLLVIVVLPASFTLIAGFSLPLRSLTAASAAIASLLILGHLSTSNGLLRSLMSVLCVLVALQGLYINSVYQARTWVVQKRDMLLAAALNNEILRVTNLGIREPIHINFLGVIPVQSVYPLVPTTTSGESFFDWDNNNNPARIVRYMNMLGFDYYVVDLKESEQLRIMYQSMPAWPKAGSIRFVDGVVSVKLSD